MEATHIGLSSVSAPLVIVQGIPQELRPVQKENRSRLVDGQKYQKDNEELQYGVQINIQRELQDVHISGLHYIVSLINKYNVRDQMWWPNQETQEPKRQLKTNELGNGCNNHKGLWFNIKYSEKSYEVIVNGSKSPLSPYNEDTKFHNSLLPLEWLYKYYDHIPTVFISVYEIGADETFDDVLVNEINRLKLKFTNTMIKFVAILVYPDAEYAKHTRIQKLMTKINMSINSLFIISGETTEMAKREQKMFIRKLMVGLRQYSSDFFDLQMQKLKRREIKSVTYNESYFSCRNLIKMAIFEQFKGVNDHSTKLLEYSYDKLLQILKTLENTSQVHSEVRGWLDIMCLHIVRSCITLGDTNVAYRKFVFHLKKVKEFDLQNFNFDWISLQYTWLGEIIENMSENVVPLDYAIMPTGGAKDKYNSFNMPQNGFIYLQAFNYRKRSIQTGKDNRILLLNAALDSFSLATTKYHRFESRIYDLLGDVYFEQRNYSMAVNNYQASISIFRREKCTIIIVFILRKIAECYIKLGKLKEASGVYVELCVLTKSTDGLDDVKEQILSLGLVNDSECGILDDMNEVDKPIVKDCFVVDVGIQKQINMMNEGIHAQIILRAPCEYLEVNSIDVDFKDFKTFTIINGGETSSVKVTDTDDEVTAILEFDTNGLLVVDMHIVCSRVGKFELPTVKFNGTINEIEFIGVCQNGFIEQSKSVMTSKYIKWINSNRMYERCDLFEVLPKIPAVKCSLKYNKIGFNGRDVPVFLKFENEDDDAVIAIKCSGSGMLIDMHEVGVVWDGESSYKSKELKPGDEIVIKAVLKLPQINGLPMFNVNEDYTNIENFNMIIKFAIDYILVNDGDVHVNIAKEGKLNVFEMIEWHTKLRSEVYGISKTLPHTRRWIFSLYLKNRSFEELELSKCKFSIKGPKGVKFKLEPDNNYDTCVIKPDERQMIKLSLDVTGIDRIIRSVPIDLTCDLAYQVESLVDAIQVYKLDMYKANLPHSDPRMLVTIKEEDSDIVTVIYVIENPKEQTFQYQSNLNTINGVEIIDYVKSQRMDVKPYSERKVELKYRISDKSGTIELPEFTLYDVQYQVFVRANVAHDRLRMIDNHLFWKR